MLYRYESTAEVMRTCLYSGKQKDALEDVDLRIVENPRNASSGYSFILTQIAAVVPFGAQQYEYDGYK